VPGEKSLHLQLLLMRVGGIEQQFRQAFGA